MSGASLPTRDAARLPEGAALRALMATLSVAESLEAVDAGCASPSHYTTASDTADPASAVDGTSDPGMSKPFSLLGMPPELIDRVLRKLTAPELAIVACTCRTLRDYAYDEVHWERFARALELPAHEGKSPFGTWREFYASHFPFWFLPKHKIWIADRAAQGGSLVGQLVLSRYDYRMGSVEVFRVITRNLRAGMATQWTRDIRVLIHALLPRTHLVLEDPVVKLDPGCYERGGRLKQEHELHSYSQRDHHGLRSRLFLAKAVPPSLITPRMALWPPTVFPKDLDRVRVESGNLFRDPAHKPDTFAEISQTAFRTRVWTDFGAGMNGIPVRMGEYVVTFSSLKPHMYTPTAEKPFQGIWIGDYSSHGCEYLLILQKTVDESMDIPAVTPMSPEELQRLGSYPAPTTPMHATPAPPPSQTPAQAIAASIILNQPTPLGHSGRLEAIKLTGDPNIPRGQYTFIVENMGRPGLLRIADEAPFTGARVVRSWGHIASEGFMDDGFIPSQLFLISPNVIAQYWEFGHISYYKRLDIDRFIDVDSYP